MSTHATTRQKPDYQNSKQEEYARWRRRDHDNIEAMQNLIIAEIAERAGVEMPSKVRQLISAIQGAHGGGEVVNDEFQRGYLGIGRQLQFTGTETAVRARVRNWINDLLLWQDSCGFTLITVKKGGTITHFAPDGAPVRECSTFIDHLLPVADEAVQLARKSEEWKNHPGRALADQVTDKMIKKLPHADTPPDQSPGNESKPLTPISEYEKDREEKIKKAVEAAVLGVEERGGDGVLWARRKLLTEMKAVVDSLEKTYGARRSWIMLDDDDESEETAPGKEEVSGNAYKGNKFDDLAPSDGPPATQLGNKNVTQLNAENPPNTMKTKEAAGHYAALSLPVFPVKPDKSPATKNSFKDATTDAAQISRWYAAHPENGIGIPTGKASGWLVLDVDPRHGGDATLTALVERHGDLPDTLRARTGGGGDHFVFAYPEGIEVRNSSGKLGAGLDIRGEGGYIVVAPSSHPSGGFYSWANAIDAAPVPAWIVEALLSKAHKPLDTDHNPILRPHLSLGRVFSEGQRNDGLFRVGCAIWGNGGAQHSSDLHAQLLTVNAQQCSPPLTDSEVAQITGSVARYTRGVSITEARS
jgi:hypothetical protein